MYTSLYSIVSLLHRKDTTHHRHRSYPWQCAWFPVNVQNLKGHKSTVYVTQRFSTLVGLSTHSHLHAKGEHFLALYCFFIANFPWLFTLLVIRLAHNVHAHLCLKELLTMAFSTSRSPMWDGPRKWNMSMVLSVGWALHKRLGDKWKDSLGCLVVLLIKSF